MSLRRAQDRSQQTNQAKTSNIEKDTSSRGKLLVGLPLGCGRSSE